MVHVAEVFEQLGRGRAGVQGGAEVAARQVQFVSLEMYPSKGVEDARRIGALFSRPLSKVECEVQLVSLLGLCLSPEAENLGMVRGERRGDLERPTCLLRSIEARVRESQPGPEQGLPVVRGGRVVEKSEGGVKMLRGLGRGVPPQAGESGGPSEGNVPGEEQQSFLGDGRGGGVLVGPLMGDRGTGPSLRVPGGDLQELLQQASRQLEPAPFLGQPGPERQGRFVGGGSVQGASQEVVRAPKPR